MPFNILGAFIGYILISSFTPGPGNILALNTMVQYGWKKGRNLIFGIGAGYATVQFICTMAIYELNEFLTPALAIIKYVGAIYLVCLTIQIIKSKLEQGMNENNANFRTGFLMQLVNVKIYFYIITLLTAYIAPYCNTLPLMLFIGVFVVAVGFIATMTWSFLGLKMQKIYVVHFKLINILLGVFLLYCAFSIIRG
ncbi:LysE family transporter [Clostridium cylindrosporum]|uniref:Putative cysteine/O-acetylserine efflux protein n=1 Tax=Clostridium cylindrosporum DSM 605 TaxID=1121307 RepID=A0A0J8D9H0_CLOCY|nr:LysE family transporter [Clostridium cylindrosporum]KMT22497.1 putative cysteine/O-acetylserine efflux protein [Clostridium cylindrosporum DSM 605]